MARLKEQSRIERERRHLEKQAKRKYDEEDGTSNKRITVRDGIIAVSDNSDESENEKYQLQNYEEEKSDHTNIDSEIASRSPSIHGGEHTSDDDRSRSRSRSRHSSESNGSHRSRSERSRSSSREEQLRLQSPKSNGNTIAAEVAKTEEKKQEVCFLTLFAQISTWEQNIVPIKNNV